MQPVKRGKRRRKKMPYLFLSGYAVKSCMTVIGNNGAVQETIKLRQFLPQFPWKSAQRPTFSFLGKTALEKQHYKPKSNRKKENQMKKITDDRLRRVSGAWGGGTHGR